MALVIEDGTGLATAESYVSVAEADAYIAKWSLAPGKTWPSSYSETQKEVALRTAARYIDLIYRVRFVSRVHRDTQALQWPRNGWVTHDYFRIDSNDIPKAVKEAQIEMAMVMANDGDPIPDTTGESITEEKNESDMTMRTVKYASPRQISADGTPVKRYPFISRVLAPVLHKRGRLDRC